MKQRVAVLGASSNPERYAYRAVQLLRAKGHQVFPVAPNLSELDGLAVVASLRDLKDPVDTLTVYVNPKISTALADEFLQLRPGRVIFNPGTENPSLAAILASAGIPSEEACTLVLLSTGQF